MRPRLQFGLRSTLIVATLVAVGIAIWQSRPVPGHPILHGRIVDVNGVPIANVNIILHSGVATRFRNQEALTDQDGKFRFAPLKTGSIVIAESGDILENLLMVGIRVEHPEFRAADGSEWWDEFIPRIKDRIHRWDLVMSPIVPGESTAGESTPDH